MIRAAKKLLLVKIEVNYNTDAGPTGVANAMLARNITLTPMEGTEIARDVVRTGFGGPINAPMAGINAKLEFDIEAAGSGTAGTAPAWGVLMRSCGWAQTLTNTVKAVYTLVSGGEESVTIALYRDGVLHKMTGARGDWSYKLASNGELLLHFALTGNYVAVVDAALPAGTFSNFKVPVPVDKTHTPTFTIMGYTAALKSLDLQQGNDVQYRNLVGLSRVDIVGRKVSGSVVIEEPPVASHNFYTDAVSATLGVIQLIHGAVAGNIIEINSSRVQIGKPTHSDDQGIGMLSLPLILSPTMNPGDDELTLTVR